MQCTHKLSYALLSIHHTQISVNDIDFFVRDIDDIKKGQLKLKEENGMYPPRFSVVIGCFQQAKPRPASFRFTGATHDLTFDVILSPHVQPSCLTCTTGYGLLCMSSIY